jgi:signal transduction histidine kinase
VALLVISYVAAVFQYLVAASFGPISALFQNAIPITAFTNLGQLLGFILLTGSIRELREATRKSNSVRQNLDFLRSNLDQQLKANRKMVLDQVQQVILPAIEKIQKDFSNEDDNQKISQELRQFIDNEVRPLSHALLEDISEDTYVPVDPNADATNPRSLLAVISQRVPVAGLFALPLFALGSVVFVLPGYWAIYGPRIAFLPAVFALLSTWLVWFLAGKLVGKRELPFIWQIPAAVLAALVASAVFAEVNILMGQSASLGFTLLQTLNVGVISLLSALFSSLQAVRWAKLQIVANSNLSTEVLIARLRQDLWLNRRRLAKLIHGSAQARLQVAILMLQKSDASAGDRLEAAKTIEAIVRELLDTSSPQMRLGETFADLQRLWQGVCDVSIEIDQELLVLIESDSSASGSLDEFVREAVTNAVKHSKAKQVRVQIVREKEESVSVIVKNPLPEGEVKLASNSAGMGSQIYSAVTVSWSLTTNESDVILHGVVPLVAKSKA